MSETSKVLETGVSNIYCSFDLVKEELLDFIQMIELEGTSPEGINSIKNEVEKHLKAVQQIEDNWNAYLISIVDDLTPEERATWAIKGDYVNVVTQRKFDETPYTNDIPIEVFKNVVEVLIQNAESFKDQIIKTSHIKNIIGEENLLSKTEKYKDKPGYLINLTFRVLLIESILKRTKGNNYQLNKSANEIRSWLVQNIK